MSRLVLGQSILGVIAVAATIAAGAPASAAAVQASPPSVPSMWAGAYSTADVGGIWLKDQIADLNRFGGIQSYALWDSEVIAGASGHNFQHRQFACIRVGRRLQC